MTLGGAELPTLPILEWGATALEDLAAIYDYIAESNPDAAQSLSDLIKAKALQLPEQPRAYRAGRVAGTREMVVRPNYLVVYRATDRAVTILRVLHTARQWP